jgi:dTDP-4-amino-4,6-dideoxygalactose transaminase
MQTLGFNYRLTDLQSALGISQLKKMAKFKKRRREIVSEYNQAFASVPNLITPVEKKGLDSVFHLYVVQIDFDQIGKSRKEVMEELKEKGIGTQVHYIPVHLQPYYQDNFGYKEGDFPVAEAYYSRCLSLPLYPKMSREDVQRVIAAVKTVVETK